MKLPNSLLYIVLFFVGSIMITACKNNPHPNRVYFSIDPADRKILIPVQLNDSIKANMVFDTGYSEGTFSLDSLLIVQNPCLISEVRSDTSLGGSGWVSERYLNLEYKNINKKVKIGNTNLTFKNLQILNWKQALRNNNIEGLFSIPKNDTTHVWELNFGHNYLEIHSIKDFKMPKNCLLCPMISGYANYAIQISMQITFAEDDTLITNHLYLVDSAMDFDIALIWPEELELLNKKSEAVWEPDMWWYVRRYTVKAKVFNSMDIDSLRIYKKTDRLKLWKSKKDVQENYLQVFNTASTGNMQLSYKTNCIFAPYKPMELE